MKRIFSLMVIALLLIAGCSKEEEIITPSGPTNVREFTGTTDKSKECSVTLGDLNGATYVTAYSITYTYSALGGNVNETHSKSNSNGLASLTNSSFVLNVTDSSPNGTINGTLNGTVINGTFGFKVIRMAGDTINVAGTFTLNKK